jgi:phosphate/sulfate permease
MNFYQNVLSTFIGAILGFIFSIFLFYLTQKWSNRTEKKSLEKNLIKELEFNEHYLSKILQDIKKTIEQITVNDKQVYYYFNYMSYQRTFIQTYFQKGYLYEKLEPEDINLIDTILTRITWAGQEYINTSIQKWKAGSLDQAQILKIMSYERDSIEKFIKDIGVIKKKIIEEKRGKL